MKKIYNLGGRNKAIVLLKFFAALLITWSHLRLLFPRYDFLVTGGALGDGMFFYCSGFTLFLGRDGGFANWYKRRIGRIYPSVISWALLSAVAFGWVWSVTDLITTPQYWFLPCIMAYYVILYLIRRFLLGYIKAVFIISFLVVTLASFFILDLDHSVMYAQVSFMRIYYFMFMLMGAMAAIGKKQDVVVATSPMRSLGKFVLSVALYYAFMAFFKLGPIYCHFQMLSLVPLLLSIHYFFILCSNEKVLSVFDRPLIGNVVYVISSLTLEVYLVQYAVFSDRLNGIFPLNIVITYLLIFILAYVLKCLSNLFLQVFGAGYIDWKRVTAL